MLEKFKNRILFSSSTSYEQFSNLRLHSKLGEFDEVRIF